MTRQRNQEHSCSGRISSSPRASPSTIRDIPTRITQTAPSRHHEACGNGSLKLCRPPHPSNIESSPRGSLQPYDPEKPGDRMPRIPTSGTAPAMRLYRTRRRRMPQTPVLVGSKATSAAVMVLAALAAVKPVQGADPTTEYLKPTVSSKACMGVAGLISTKSTSLGNDGACMQCDPANNVCPPGCQALIDQLYTECDGVTTPDGLYFDPDNSIEGGWSDQIRNEIKIATERCGCDDSNRLAPLGTNLFFQASLPASIGLAAMMTSLASWFAAVLLLTTRNDHR